MSSTIALHLHTWLGNTVLGKRSLFSSLNARRAGGMSMTGYGSLATKLEALIREHYASRGEKVPGTAAIAKDIRDGTGLRISTGTLHKLRTGQTDVPTGNRLQALAEFFGRPMAFFLDREASNDDMELAVALRDKGVRAIALRSADLSERSRRAILDMIDRAREIEQLDSPTAEKLDEPRREG